MPWQRVDQLQVVGSLPRLAELVDPLWKVPCKAIQNQCRTRPVPQSGLVVTESRHNSKLWGESRYDSYCEKQMVDIVSATVRLVPLLATANKTPQDGEAYIYIYICGSLKQSQTTKSRCEIDLFVLSSLCRRDFVGGDSVGYPRSAYRSESRCRCKV